MEQFNFLIMNEDINHLKELENIKMGVSIRIMRAKIYGCFQKHISDVKILINDNCIGRTCNDIDFYEYRNKIKEAVSIYDTNF